MVLKALADRVLACGEKEVVSRGSSEGNVEVTGDLKVRGVSLEVVTGLQQLVNNLQAQLASLQQKEAADVQGIADSLEALAGRIASLEAKVGF